MPSHVGTSYLVYIRLWISLPLFTPTRKALNRPPGRRSSSSIINRTKRTNYKMTTRTMVVKITMTPTRRCLPFDVIPFIVEHLDRRDLYNAALVSRDFNRVSAAFLYHTLDSRLFHSVKVSGGLIALFVCGGLLKLILVFLVFMTGYYGTSPSRDVAGETKVGAVCTMCARKW